MQLVSRRNFIIFLAGILVVALGLMAMTLVLQNQIGTSMPETYQQEIQKVQTQSESDNIDAIEKDLMETDLNDLDKELQDIESELQ